MTASAPTPQTTRTRRILLAEDDEELRKLLAQILRKEGYLVTECADGFQLLGHLDSLLISPETSASEPEAFDLIISDIRMPGITGMSILEGVELFEGFPPMILITAFGDKEMHRAAEQLGAFAMVDKPFETEELLRYVHGALGEQEGNGN